MSKRDEVTVLGTSANGKYLGIRHHEGKDEPVVITPIKEGSSLPENAYLLTPTGSGRYAVESLNGPAQVATKQYRDNYDSIFGKQPIGQA